MKSIRTFYTIVLTQIFSLIGSQMTGFAIGIWVFKDTGNATPLLLVAFFMTLPHMVANSFAGVFADRWERKHAIMIGDIGQAIPTFFLMLAFMNGFFELWQLYLAVIVQATFSMVQGPAFAASVTMLVPEEQFDRANAFRQMSMPLSGLIAPILAGFLYAFIKVEGIMAIDLITFLVAIAVISQVTIPRPEESEESRKMKGSVWREVRGGFVYLRERPALLGLVIYFSLVNFMLAGPFNLTTPYIISLTDDEKLLGLIMMLFNVGMVAGGIIFGIWGGTKPRIHTIMLAILMAGLALTLYGVAQVPLLLGLAVFLSAFPIPMANASVSSILQTKIPPDMQGRVFAMLSQISAFAMPFSFLLIGPLVDKVLEPAVNSASWWSIVEPVVGNQPGAGMGLVMVVAGSVLTVVSVAVYALPAIRHMEANMPDYKPVAAETEEKEPTGVESAPGVETHPLPA